MSIIKVKTGGITADAITSTEIADNAVVTAAINADAVTDAKIADDVVGTEHLTANEVDTTALGADAVTAAQIADDAISEEHLDVTAVTGHTAETSIADGDTILIHDASASALRKMTKANFVSGVGSDFTPNFLSYIASPQTLSTNTITLVTFNTEQYDSDSSFNTSSYNYTIPSGEAGKYVLYFQLRRETFAGARFFGTIIRTRSGTESDLITAENNGGSDAYDTIYSMIVADCLAGDTFHVVAKHNDSGNRSIYGGTSSSFFGGYKLV